MAEPHLPTIRYHPTQPSRLIATAEDLAALSPEWQDLPYTPEARLQWLAQQAAPGVPPPAPPLTPPPARKR